MRKTLRGIRELTSVNEYLLNGSILTRCIPRPGPQQMAAQNQLRIVYISQTTKLLVKNMKNIYKILLYQDLSAIVYIFNFTLDNTKLNKLQKTRKAV